MAKKIEVLKKKLKGERRWMSVSIHIRAGKIYIEDCADDCGVPATFETEKEAVDFVKQYGSSNGIASAVLIGRWVDPIL